MALYSKATESYYKCINNPVNKFLEKEISIPIAAVRVEQSTVKIVFWQEDVSGYTLETELTLWGDEKDPIGRYWLVVNDKEEVIDEGLVWY